MLIRSRQHVLLWFVATVPWFFLVTMYAFFSLDFPYLDQWEFPVLLEKYYDGELTFYDFWAQHNEHRLLFPRLVMLGAALATDWNIYYELGINLVLGTVLFALCCVLLRFTHGNDTRFRALVPLVSVLLFSLSQWGNWFLGWQLQVFMNLVAVTGVFLLLSHPKQHAYQFVAALVLAVVATYSFANGLVVWLLGAFLIGLVAKRGRAVRLVSWLLVGAVTTATYLYQYQRPAHHPSLDSLFEKALQYPLYVFKYLGQPVVNFNGVGAAMAGFIGLGVFTYFAYRLLKEKDVASAMLGPCLALGAYAIVSALITGVARIGDPEGSAQAMSSRYATIANLLWVANIALASLAYFEGGTQGGAQGVGTSGLRRYGKRLAMLFAVLVVASSLHGAYRWTERYHAYQQFYWSDDAALLRRIYPDVAALQARRDILRRYRLSVYVSVQGQSNQ